MPKIAKIFTKTILFALVANLIIGNSAFGQIAQRGGSTNAISTTTSITIAKPTGVVSGDVMIANIAQGGNNNTAASLSGWTIVDGRSLGSGGANRYGTVLYRVADGTEGANFIFTLGAGVDAASGSVIAFSGVNATGGVKADGSAGGPFDVDPGTLNLEGNASTIATALGITTVSANAAVIMLSAAAGNNPTWSSWTSTSPGGLTELYDNPNGSNTKSSVGAAWAIKATGGATGNGTASLSPGERNGSILIALKPNPSATLSPSGTRYILVGGSVSLTATAANYSGSGNYTYTWTAAGATIPGANPNNIAASSDSKSLTYAAAGTYTVRVTIARSGSATLLTNITTVIVAPVPAVPNMWASSSNGTQISGYTVVNGIYINGPTNIFAPTFPGTTTGGTTTAAIGKNDQGGPLDGYFYWLPNTAGNGGVVEVFAATSTGTDHTRIGSVDVNGSNTSNLGFVRLGMGPDGNGWILAGDATNLYLAKFMSNGVNPVTITTVPLILSGGFISTFQNGDVCVLGNNNLYALANDGSGLTQIFIGSLNNPTVTLTKKWDLVDQSNVPFTGSVNGVAFDAIGSLYITTAVGLYFIDQATINGPAGTVQCTLIDPETGLQDLGSAWFPTGSTLPVTLVNFLGSYDKQKTTLMWETENMMNFSHFEIERSTTAGNFASVGIKNPQGNGMSRTQYQYVDDLSGVNGSTFYYRLKMVDIDGHFKYSNVLVIRKDKKTTDLVVNPNPVMSGVNKATANFTTSTSGKINFNVIDMSGKVVLTQQNSVSPGNNSVTINNLDRLQSGIYMLQLHDGETRTTAKFYIVH
ncbi:MAG: T9SS type A sorting domain-containing protein [Ferruginibacter sp.]